jgi:hypothetical protein
MDLLDRDSAHGRDPDCLGHLSGRKAAYGPLSLYWSFAPRHATAPAVAARTRTVPPILWPVTCHGHRTAPFPGYANSRRSSTERGFPPSEQLEPCEGTTRWRGDRTLIGPPSSVARRREPISCNWWGPLLVQHRPPARIIGAHCWGAHRSLRRNSAKPRSQAGWNTLSGHDLSFT